MGPDPLLLGGVANISLITFLASSKPFVIPKEIQEKQNQRNFKNEEELISFSVQPLDAYWLKETEELFSLPFIYEVQGRTKVRISSAITRTGGAIIEESTFYCRAQFGTSCLQPRNWELCDNCCSE